MKTFIEQAHLYAEYHQKKETLYTHLVGIPLILLSLMIFLGFFKLIVPDVFATTLASIGTLVLFIYYLRLNWLLALFFAPVLVLLLWISSLVSHAGPTAFAFWTFIIVFILGCGLQLVGHMIEGKKPALLDNAWHALIAPLFLTAEVCFMLGQMQALKEQVHGTTSITTQTPL
jgi:uncharacterized membrane protein YGL010W